MFHRALCADPCLYDLFALFALNFTVFNAQSQGERFSSANRWWSSKSVHFYADDAKLT